MKLSRRNTLQLLGGTALAASMLGPRRAQAATRITVLNWQGYGTDEKWALEIFSQATGIEVVHDYFNSEAEMITKLATNPGAYDVVLINSARIAQAAGQGLIQPVDFSKIPNSLGLAGFNNVNLLKGLPRMLATMDACRFEIGTKAAEIVAARALGIGEVGEQRVILTPGIIRGDTLRSPGQ